MREFRLPPRDRLDMMGPDQRLNIFRQYFASSRYNRLVIQQTLVRAALDQTLYMQISKLEQEHNTDFIQTVGKIKEYGYMDEFIGAVKEEEFALQKIIEAYNKKMGISGG